MTRKGNGKTPDSTNLKLNKDNIEALCKIVAKGRPISCACGIVGVQKSTVYNWIHEAEAIGDREPENNRERLVLYWMHGYQKARAMAMDALLDKAESAAVDEKCVTKLAMWRLERQHFEDFAEHHNVKADVKTDGPCEAAQALLAVAELTKKEKDDA